MAFLTGLTLDKLSKLFEITEGSGDRTTDSNEAISTKIGTPADTDVSTDIANVQASVDAIPTTAPVVSATACTTNGVIVEDGTSGTPNIVSVAPSGTTNTFGAWTEIDASTSANSWLTCVTDAIDGLVGDIKSVIEIGIGGAGAEVTIWRKSYQAIFGASESFNTMNFNLSLPKYIASGTRIAARVSQTGTGTNAHLMSIQRYQSIET